ncbi:hypothetical protein [Thalassovita sp.]|uniref:hypothetical protein n=1 Tax=Thalassovita sp. TaxID=1979401 RepID=UPI0029DE6AF2|nr:hypothetical protein [Thalassovita sp.]
MRYWEIELANARMNILRCSDAAEVSISEVANDAGVDPGKLRQFIVGADSLTFGEVLRICNSMEFPLWALHVPEVSMDVGPQDPNTLKIDQRILALKLSA